MQGISRRLQKMKAMATLISLLMLLPLLINAKSIGVEGDDDALVDQQSRLTLQLSTSYEVGAL